MAGDQQAALFGQTCFEVGDAKCTYGTGAFLLMNTGTELVHSKNGLLTTIAWRLGDETVYALEGSAFIAGAAVQWLRDGLGLIASSDEIEAKAREVDATGDVVFVPALAGLGAPHWDPRARGLIYGLTRDTTAAHLARATLDGIAFSNRRPPRRHASPTRDRSCCAPPGRRWSVPATTLLMQVPVGSCCGVDNRPPRESIETTALGAAYLRGSSPWASSTIFDAIVQAHRIDA